MENKEENSNGSLQSDNKQIYSKETLLEFNTNKQTQTQNKYPTNYNTIIQKKIHLSKLQENKSQQTPNINIPTNFY